MDALCRLQWELASCHVPYWVHTILGPSTHTRAAWSYKVHYTATHIISLRIIRSGFSNLHIVKHQNGSYCQMFILLVLSTHLETFTHIQPQLSGLKRESTHVKNQIQLITNPIYFSRCKRQENSLPYSRERTGQRMRTCRNLSQDSSRIEQWFFFFFISFVIQSWWVD